MSDPVWEDIITHIDEMVMDAVESSAANLSSVIKVHDKLMEVSELALATEYPQLGQIAQKCAEIAMTIVLQEAQEPERTLDTVIETTSCLQCMAREIIKGNSPAYIPVPDGLHIRSEELFEASEASVVLNNDTVVTTEVSLPEKEIVSIKDEVTAIVENIFPLAEESSSSTLKKIPVFDMGSLTPSHLNDFLNEMYELIERGEERLLDLEKSPQQSKESINELLGVFHTIKGISGIIKLQEIIDLAHTAEVLLEKTTFLTADAVELLFDVIDIFKGYGKSLKNYQIEKKCLEVADPASLISALQKLALTDSTLAEQINIDSKPKKDSSTAVKTLPTEQDASKTHPKHKISIDQSLQQETLKISTQRLDSLINSVGELVIAQAMIEHDPAISSIKRRDTVRNINALGKITRELQELSMAMRMVTIQSTFQAMERVIRDLAHEQGKNIEVVISGKNTELDRNIIETMYKPLIHLIRNAVDHGIESPKIRRECNKPKKGQVRLNAYHRGGNIIIEIQDDGKGLHKEKILEEAIRKDILAPDQQYRDDIIFQSVFVPGFSTAGEITEISGRGVGLDIVKRNVEKFRGKVEIESEPNKGSTFRIILPLTLAIIDGMLVKVCEQRYIIPLVHIEEFVQIQQEQLSTIAGKGQILMLRDKTLPVFDLENILQINASTEKGMKQSVGVIVSWEDKRCCFLVWELMSQQQVVIKSLGDDFKNLVGISGGTILGDGCVGLILDVQQILQMTIKPKMIAV